MGKKTQHQIVNTLINLISRQLITALAFFLGTGLLIIFVNLQSSDGFTIIPKYVYSDSVISLSTPKPHPLPPTLAQWQDSTNSGDYFSQITTTQVGYLVWSQFPVRVYVELPKAISEKQAQVWVKSVLQGVQEWNTYLPLIIVEQPEIADIAIARKVPPLQISPGSNIPRARSAQTTYELYTSNNVLSHRFTILLSPSQIGEYLIAATRHEFGHALGIWGHSPLQTDALYFSQVRNPLPISSRDVNTLKRVYEQPTSLGWSSTDNSKIN
ncbi:peptidase [Nostoc sp. 'Peltigera membranacea cyanobiont' 213]|uniref:peptidase n=1 Tax=Nostoc sp. 'Peltigera membranacea cyanobiont' 213 TaxID=2014530 RepID=UPI000B9538C3|nr:peptidase [Nostoc sp. 'Peltigera membranacea cyanobiont' 213]OYD98451.1 peptidase [Nostoc sp. 'Peltigera membranacea cyanobiont' 213]